MLGTQNLPDRHQLSLAITVRECGGESGQAQRPRPAGAEQELRACSPPWHCRGCADLLCVHPAKAGAAGSSLPMTAGRGVPGRSPPVSPLPTLPPGARLAAQEVSALSAWVDLSPPSRDVLPPLCRPPSLTLRQFVSRPGEKAVSLHPSHWS